MHDAISCICTHQLQTFYFQILDSKVALDLLIALLVPLFLAAVQAARLSALRIAEPYRAITRSIAAVRSGDCFCNSFHNDHTNSLSACKRKHGKGRSKRTDNFNTVMYFLHLAQFKFL